MVPSPVRMCIHHHYEETLSWNGDCVELILSCSELYDVECGVASRDISVF